MTYELGFDPHSALFTVYDAVHGAVDLREPGTKIAGNIIRLLNSPMVERLRRIKQLGYASHSYTAADHSRYAHAIGTMHMMRTLLNHLIRSGAISDQVYVDLQSTFKLSAVSQPLQENRLVRHMLVAALLQDVGELPYGKATGLFLKPSAHLRQKVRNGIGFPHVNDWSDKEIFTIACIQDKRSKEILFDLEIDEDFLIFLITGRLRGEQGEKASLVALRHMLDGEVDADRLDYVFRDAYHTVGGFGMPKTVVDSLLFYDECGPVFSDTGAIADFLTLRAHLWTTVYFSPQNRFRMILLTTLLSGIKDNDDCAAAFFDGAMMNGLSFKDFEQLDDISLTAQITEFDKRGKSEKLNERANIALKILLGNGVQYECIWLPRPESIPAEPKKVVIPDDLFFDTFSNFQDHSLYQPESIRVKNEKLKFLGGTLALEKCCGAFSPVFTAEWSALPMPAHHLLYLPRDREGGVWQQLYSAIAEGHLYDELLRNDPLMADFITDTRDRVGFKGQSIFISFAWHDERIVRNVVNALLKKKRRYHLIFDPFQGIGGGTKSNSSFALREADSVLIIASTKYIAQYEANSGENILTEIEETISRHESEGLVPVFLSIDEYQELKSKLPFNSMGVPDPPFIGPPLKDLSGVMLEKSVAKALEALDEEWQSRKVDSP